MGQNKYVKFVSQMYLTTFVSVNLKIGIIIPDRNDRPKFLENCLRLIKNQTLQPEIVEIVNDEPLNSDIDITWRYRLGYDRLRNKGLDLIAFVENDDYYSPNYLEWWANKWQEAKPDILGSNFTIYYHIGLRKYFTFHHEQRVSAMNTFIKPDLTFDWCEDNDPYTDIHLWSLTNKQGFEIGRPILKGQIVHPPILSIGIKHGVGLCGGMGHTNRFHRFTHEDNGFLSKHTDTESYVFYTELGKQI